MSTGPHQILHCKRVNLRFTWTINVLLLYCWYTLSATAHTEHGHTFKATGPYNAKRFKAWAGAGTGGGSRVGKRPPWKKSGWAMSENFLAIVCQ